jgi:citrate lyase synthetase
MNDNELHNSTVRVNSTLIRACSLIASEGSIEQLVVLLARETERLQRYCESLESVIEDMDSGMMSLEEELYEKGED